MTFLKIHPWRIPDRGRITWLPTLWSGKKFMIIIDRGRPIHEPKGYVVFLIAGKVQVWKRDDQRK